MGRAPLPPALPTQDTLQELLDETDGLLQASQSFQRQAHVIESIEYLRRSHVNVVAMVRLWRKQQELERPPVALLRKLCELSGMEQPQVKEIALKKPPVKRRRKSEVEDHTLHQGNLPTHGTGNLNGPLDMPSLL